MPRFANAQTLLVGLTLFSAALGIQVELQPSASSLASPTNLAAHSGPFDWMKKLLGRSSSSHKAVDIPATKVVKLEIYYETLCPYCLSLFNESVREIFKDEELMKRVDIHIYPFGNAMVIAKENISKGYQFWHEQAVYPVFKCQHEDQECLGNMIQACAIDQLKTPELYVPLTICMSSFGSQFGIEKTSYECGVQLGIDMHSIKDCVDSRTGSELLAELGNESTRPELNRTHVPWVVINGVHEDAADDGKLLEPLCLGLEEPRPSLCNKTFGSGMSRSALACGGKKGGHGC